MNNLDQNLQWCPFCEAIADCKISTEEQAFNVTVHCTKCGVSMSKSHTKELSINELQYVLNSLVDKWNTRTVTSKNYSNDQLKITYMQNCDAVVTWVNGESMSFSLDRTRLKEAIAEYDKQHIEAQKAEWWFADEGFECSKCGYESRYMFTKCPGCNRTMKNGTD